VFSDSLSALCRPQQKRHLYNTSYRDGPLLDEVLVDIIDYEQGGLYFDGTGMVEKSDDEIADERPF
jgi:hypothetical protein